MANPDDREQAELVADTDGEVTKVRIEGGHLAQALKAGGGMVDLKLTSPSSPVRFSPNGYQLVIMPILTAESQGKLKQELETTEQVRQKSPTATTTTANSVQQRHTTEIHSTLKATT